MRPLRVALSALTFTGLVAAASRAQAFCGFYVSGADGKLFADATQVVLMREGQRTVLSMQNDYKGPPEKFALVIPVPVVLQKENVKVLAKEIFDRVDKLGAPRLVEYWEQDPCAPEQDFGFGGLGLTGVGAGGGGSGTGIGLGGLGVNVEAKFAVGEYEIVILSAKDAAGLDTWLKQEKYAIPEGAEPYFRPYVASGSKFFVAKVDPAKIKLENGRAALSPLRFHYDTDTFKLPVRLGLINSGGKQDLIVNILAKQTRYEAANYANAFIPTNLDVAEAARPRFGEFYASLFDKVIERPAGDAGSAGAGGRKLVVVTEYAWGAGTCDPCPGPTLDAGDAATLGADVLEGGIVGPAASTGIGTSGPGGTATGSARSSVRSERPIVPSGRLPVEVIERIARRNFGRFRSCHEAALRLNPATVGRLVVKFRIERDGSVSGASDGGGTITDATMKQCVINGLGNLTFPQPEGGVVEVSYPLLFAIDSRPAAQGLGALGAASPYVLTRLHLRYDKDTLGDDIVFKAAPPVSGGREVRGEGNLLEKGAQPASVNNFQGRYAIRHPWTGPIACKEPRRGVWGGPPAGDGGAFAGTTPSPVAAQKLAFVQRGASLSSFVTGPLPDLGVPASDPNAAASASAAPSTVAPPSSATTPTPEPPAKKGLCAAGGAIPRSSPGTAAALAALALLSIRRLARRRPQVSVR